MDGFKLESLQSSKILKAPLDEIESKCTISNLVYQMLNSSEGNFHVFSIKQFLNRESKEDVNDSWIHYI